MVTKAEALAELARRGIKAPAAPSKLSDGEKTLIRDLSKSAGNALKVATDAEKFVALNKQKETGGWLGVGTPWGSIGDIAASFDPNLAQMSALSNRMAPNFRQAGDPSTREMQMYKRSAPSIELPREANAQIQKDLQGDSDRAAAHAAFMDRWGQLNGTTAGGEEAFLRFWNQRQQKKAAPAAGGVQILSVEPD